jgi:hypothetical protein
MTKNYCRTVLVSVSGLLGISLGLLVIEILVTISQIERFFLGICLWVLGIWLF